MRTLDLSPLYRSTVGFDRLFDLLDGAAKVESGGYPPYNIEHTSENAYRVTMAVAGFAPEDLNVEVRDNTLIVSGQRPDASGSETTYLHRGIATRGFERRFELADHVRIQGASLRNGLLDIDLVREIPEEKKPRRIEIAVGAPDGQAALKSAAA
ncbi:MAG: Hsp20 family protein [Alphaproteobacteria bacterium]|nr:Hsp20 family protein [Alphaproteobacteria bacterium]